VRANVSIVFTLAKFFISYFTVNSNFLDFP
jgi:hypothetical protein